MSATIESALQRVKNLSKSNGPNPTGATASIRTDLRSPEPWTKVIIAGLDAIHPKVQAAADAAGKFCARWFERDVHRQPWLALGGQAGAGKTTIARRCCRYMSAHATDAWQNGRWEVGSLPEVVFWHWPKVSALKPDDWDAIATDGERASCLFIDDIGAEIDRFKSGEPTLRLLSILEARTKLFTMVTTNVERIRWKDAWDARVADRLRTAGYVNMFDVPSFRALKGTA